MKMETFLGVMKTPRDFINVLSQTTKNKPLKVSHVIAVL